MYMGFGKPKTGLFGAPVGARSPYETPGIGDGMTVQHTPQERVAAQPTEPKKSGMFGKGGVGRAIAGTIGDFLMQRSGMAPVYAPTMMQERQAAAQAAAEQRKRAQELADWRMKEDYKRENPSQTTFQQDYEYIRRNFGEDAANTYRENKINPPVWRQGADGQFYRVETAQPQVLGDSLPEGWEIEGGPTQPASGGF